MDLQINIPDQEVFRQWGLMLGLTVFTTYNERYDEHWLGFSSEPQECKARPYAKPNVSIWGYDYVEVIGAFDNHGNTKRILVISHVAYGPNYGTKDGDMLEWLHKSVREHEQALRLMEKTKE